MRIRIFPLLLLFFINPLFGQDSLRLKGRYLLDGNFSLLNYGGDYYGEQSALQIGVGLDRYLFENFAIGGKIMFNNLKIGNNSNSNIFLGPCISASFSPFTSSNLESRIFIKISYFLIRENISTGFSGSSWNGTSLQYSGGIMTFILKNVSLNSEIGYSFDRYDPPEMDKVDGTRFFLILGFSLLL